MRVSVALVLFLRFIYSLYIVFCLQVCPHDRNWAPDLITNGHEPLCSCSELNVGSLEDYLDVLTSNLSPYSLFYLYY